MAHWSAEEWSFGSGRSRISCRISSADEGFIVDLLQGESCVESFVYRSRLEALEGAHILKARFKPQISPTVRGPRKPI